MIVYLCFSFFSPNDLIHRASGRVIYMEESTKISKSESEFVDRVWYLDAN